MVAWMVFELHHGSLYDDTIFCLKILDKPSHDTNDQKYNENYSRNSSTVGLLPHNSKNAPAAASEVVYMIRFPASE